MTTGNDDTHWLEVFDRMGQFPIKRLGPYASERLADRARRGVMRLLNVGRCSAAVVSQRDLDDSERDGACSGADRQP